MIKPGEYAAGAGIDASIQNNENGNPTWIISGSPVQSVLDSIKILDGNVISIWADPTKINNHFRNTPIFGTVTKDVIVKK